MNTVFGIVFVISSLTATELTAQETTTECRDTGYGVLKCDTKPKTPTGGWAGGLAGLTQGLDDYAKTLRAQQDAEQRKADRDAHNAAALRQAKAQADLFVMRARAVSDAITDSLHLKGATSQDFKEAVYPFLLTLFDANPLADNTAIREIMQPTAARFARRDAAFRLRLDSVVAPIAAARNFNDLVRGRFYQAASEVVDTLRNNNLDASTDEMRSLVGDILVAFPPMPAQKRVPLKHHKRR